MLLVPEPAPRTTFRLLDPVTLEHVLVGLLAFLAQAHLIDTIAFRDVREAARIQAHSGRRLLRRITPSRWLCSFSCRSPREQVDDVIHMNDSFNQSASNKGRDQWQSLVFKAALRGVKQGACQPLASKIGTSKNQGLQHKTCCET